MQRESLQQEAAEAGGGSWLGWRSGRRNAQANFEQTTRLLQRAAISGLDSWSSRWSAAASGKAEARGGDWWACGPAAGAAGGDPCKRRGSKEREADCRGAAAVARGARAALDVRLRTLRTEIGRAS